jgi:hypothetical protein
MIRSDVIIILEVNAYVIVTAANIYDDEVRHVSIAKQWEHRIDRSVPKLITPEQTFVKRGER